MIADSSDSPASAAGGVDAGRRAERREDFTAADLAQLAAAGIAIEEARRQLALLRRQPALRKLIRPCRVGDGIERWDAATRERLEALGRSVAAAEELELFVPASGAATRMFEPIAWALGDPTWTLHDLERRALTGDLRAAGLLRFWAARERLALWPHLLAAATAAQVDIGARSETAVRAALELLLAEGGLAYERQPKGLIAFHREGEHIRTAFAEQILEGLDLAGTARLHFHATVAPGFEEAFRAEARRAVDSHPSLAGRLDLELSTQDSSTDTVAIDEHEALLRDDDGRLVLRPGGHGSLLANLGRLRRRYVLVRNVDNVQPRAARERNVRSRLCLLGRAAELQSRSFALLEDLTSPQPSDAVFEAAEGLVKEAFGLPAGASTLPRERSARRATLERLLDRPLRVCGMVPNSGEPGGGPFWVEGDDGTVSKQIVESAEIDLHQPQQRTIWQAATHFNPVDLALAPFDREGRIRDLDRHRNADAVFVAHKTHRGRKIRALEHPGLWNGAMAQWATVFAETAAESFSPVKTILDLLRPEHQDRSSSGASGAA